jgi:hypothetical protein
LREHAIASRFSVVLRVRTPEHPPLRAPPDGSVAAFTALLTFFTFVLDVTDEFGVFVALFENQLFLVLQTFDLLL